MSAVGRLAIVYGGQNQSHSVLQGFPFEYELSLFKHSPYSTAIRALESFGQLFPTVHQKVPGQGQDMTIAMYEYNFIFI